MYDRNWAPDGQQPEGIIFFCKSTHIQVNFHTYILLFSFLWIYTSISFPLFFIIIFFLEHPYAYWFVILISICAMICVSMISMNLLFLQESALVLQLSCFNFVRNFKYIYISSGFSVTVHNLNSEGIKKERYVTCKRVTSNIFKRSLVYFYNL